MLGSLRTYLARGFCQASLVAAAGARQLVLMGEHL